MHQSRILFTASIQQPTQRTHTTRITSIRQWSARWPHFFSSSVSRLEYCDGINVKWQYIKCEAHTLLDADGHPNRISIIQRSIRKKWCFRSLSLVVFVFNPMDRSRNGKIQREKQFGSLAFVSSLNWAHCIRSSSFRCDKKRRTDAKISIYYYFLTVPFFFFSRWCAVLYRFTSENLPLSFREGWQALPILFSVCFHSNENLSLVALHAFNFAYVWNVLDDEWMCHRTVCIRTCITCAQNFPLCYCTTTHCDGNERMRCHKLIISHFNRIRICVGDGAVWLKGNNTLTPATFEKLPSHTQEREAKLKFSQLAFVYVAFFLISRANFISFARTWRKQWNI